MLGIRWSWYQIAGPNDVGTNSAIQGQHPGRIVVGKDCRHLYQSVGIVHSVTQQQPVGLIGANILETFGSELLVLQNCTNPFAESAYS